MHLCCFFLRLMLYVVGGVSEAGIKGSTPDILSADTENGDRTIQVTSCQYSEEG